MGGTAVSLAPQLLRKEKRQKKRKKGKKRLSRTSESSVRIGVQLIELSSCLSSKSPACENGSLALKHFAECVRCVGAVSVRLGEKTKTNQDFLAVHTHNTHTHTHTHSDTHGQQQQVLKRNYVTFTPAICPQFSCLTQMVCQRNSRHIRVKNNLSEFYRRR